MVKVIGIVEDNAITGVRYGTIDIPETPTAISVKPVKPVYNHALEQAKKQRTVYKQRIRQKVK